LVMLGCSADSGGQPAVAKTEPVARPAVAVEAITVEARELVEGIDVVGTLAPKYEAQVKLEVPGRISEVYVTQWVRVAVGQPLARVDTRELETSLQKAKAAVDAVRASEAAVRAALLEAQVAADRARREYDRLMKLKEVGLATQQGLDDGHGSRSLSLPFSTTR